ncbi:IclR family transcriptional regulator [Sphaerisporangium fuscum]|uniref:IclR family transcriptional regulator n=1 Tax=Sphaerisporangium fuscum TaxID=2835868 RepID=UPI001BDD3372|nr:IclR family transcriptional regulator [Sphaerisporangium fuscum]
MSGSLERALDALELLAEGHETTLAGLAKRLGASRATVHRLLAVLQERGYVRHLPQTHEYRLGPALNDLTARSDSASLIPLAAPVLAELSRLTGETINLAVLRRGRIVWADTVDAVHAIRLTTTLGERVPPHGTAIGKAILATLPEREWGALLGQEPYARLTPSTCTTLAELRPALDEARAHGYALDEEESEIGGICLAAAVLGRADRPIGAISVSAVAARLPRTQWPQIGEAVRQACTRLSTWIKTNE